MLEGVSKGIILGTSSSFAEAYPFAKQKKWDYYPHFSLFLADNRVKSTIKRIINPLHPKKDEVLHRFA